MQLGPGDVRVSYSYALVLIKHRKFDDADRLLAAIVKAKPYVLPAWKMKIRGRVLAGEHVTAATDMIAMAGTFPAGEAAAKYQQAAAFLGSVVGYYDKAAGGAIAPEALQSYATTLASRLPAAYRKSFDEARTAAVRRWGELADAIDRARRQEKADQEKKKELDLQYVAEERERIAGERAGLKEQAAQFKASLEGQVEALNAKLEPLQKRHSELLAEAQPLRREMRSLEGAIARLQDDEDGGNRGEIGRLADRHRRVKSDYDRIAAEGRRVEGEGQRLRLQRAALFAQFQKDIQRLNRANTLLTRSERVLRTKEVQATRPATSNSPRARAMERSAAMLSTYDPFSLEAERDLVLSTFR